MPSERWKSSPLPADPSAWLYRVAANRLIGDLRQHSRRLAILERHSKTEFRSSSSLPEAVSEDEIADDLLKMLFFCCDNTMPIESQLVLALKTLCGFDVREIAQRLFTSEENVYKRLGRARGHMTSKKKSAIESTPLEYSTRLPAFHHVLYLLFTEGYLSTQFDFSVRNDLCREAIRLAELLVHSSVGATPETAALLALMYFHSARTSARVDGSGGLVLLEDQDGSMWNRKYIQSGLSWLELSAQGKQYSRYHAEAAIAAELGPSRSPSRRDLPKPWQFFGACCRRPGWPCPICGRRFWLICTFEMGHRNSGVSTSRKRTKPLRRRLSESYWAADLNPIYAAPE